MNKRILSYVAFATMVLVGGTLTSCQDKSYEEFPTLMQPVNKADVKASLVGDNYVISWNQLPEGVNMIVTRYAGSSPSGSETVQGTQYVHTDVETNIAYTYVLKTTDKDGNLSSGVVLEYTRLGATRIEGLSLSQVDKADGYDMKVEWKKSADATDILLTATNGSRKVEETLKGDAASYTISDVKTEEEWNVTVVAKNEKGSSLSTKSSLKIGKTMIGFLSVYSTPEELVANGDDDEASAWLWTASEYPTAKFVSFNSVKSKADLDQYRVLFWLRDLEGVGEDVVFNMPDDVKAATPFIQEWYKNGGSLLLWSHAIPYVETIGRIPEGIIQSNDRAIGTGFGGWNGDTWSMAVSQYPGNSFKLDYSNHPIYRGLEIIENDRCKLIPFKGAGWTEDHNCLFFNYPAQLTGKGNQDKACYDIVTSQYGIYPLGVWDSQIEWIGQLNVWEAQQGNTEFKGTILCIGNGGCEFSMKNADGSKDVQAYPKNNPYQDNVLTLAKNSLEYLKTR